MCNAKCNALTPSEEKKMIQHPAYWSSNGTVNILKLHVLKQQLAAPYLMFHVEMEPLNWEENNKEEMVTSTWLLY